MWHGAAAEHSGGGGGGQADDNCNSWTSSSSKQTGRASLFRHPQLTGAGENIQDRTAGGHNAEAREQLLVSCDSSDMAFLCVHLTHTPSRSEAL